MVLERVGLDGLAQTQMQKTIDSNVRRSSQSGITMIETMMASFILVVGSLSMIGLIVRSIATNNRNKLDSTQMMLATSIVEQINATIIGSGTSALIDCSAGSHTINTAPGSIGFAAVSELADSEI